MWISPVNDHGSKLPVGDHLVLLLLQLQPVRHELHLPDDGVSQYSKLLETGLNVIETKSILKDHEYYIHYVTTFRYYRDCKRCKYCKYFFYLWMFCSSRLILEQAALILKTDFSCTLICFVFWYFRRWRFYFQNTFIGKSSWSIW